MSWKQALICWFFFSGISCVEALYLNRLVYAENLQFRPNNEILEKAEKLLADGQSKQALVKLSNFRGDKSTSRYYFLIARANQDLRNNSEAIAFYTLALREEPKMFKAYINRALVKGSMKDIKGALRDLQKAKELNANSPELFLNLGVTQAALNQPEAAIASFNQALALKPDYPDALRNRGIIHYHSKNIKKACSDWQKSLEYKKSNEIKGVVSTHCP